MPVEMRPVTARRVGFEKERGVLAIQGEPGVAVLQVALGGREGIGSEMLPALRALRPLADRGVGIRFVKIYPDCLGFVASQEDLPAVREALSGAGVSCEVAEGCAVVTVVAPNMRSIPGLMARMGEVLDGRGIEVYQTADSHSSVACVIPGERMADAAEALRGEFGLAEEAG